MSSASTLLSAPTSAATVKINRSASHNNLLLGQRNERQSTISPSKSKSTNAQPERSVGSSAATADTAAQALLALNAASAARMTVSRRSALPKNASGVTRNGPALAPLFNRSALPMPQAQALADIAITVSTSSTNSSTRIGMGTETRSSDVQPLPEVSSLNARKTTRDRQRIVRGGAGTASGTSSASTSVLASSLSISSNMSLRDREDDSQNRLAAAADHFVNLDAAEAASVDRPHACSKCSCQFTRSSHLVDHMRAKHDGTKPFSCNEVRHSKCKLARFNGACKVISQLQLCIALILPVRLPVHTIEPAHAPHAAAPL